MSVVCQDGTFLQPADARDRPRALQRVLNRATMLPRRDRVIVELALGDRLSIARISMAVGLSRGQVSRRFRAICVRIHQPIVGTLLEPDCQLSSSDKQIGLAHFLLGKPIAMIADERTLSADQVGRRLSYLRGWHCGIKSTRR